MSGIWNRYLEKEIRDGISSEELSCEEILRREDPFLYDAALCVYEFDDHEYLKYLIESELIDVNSLSPRSHQPLLFLSIVKNRCRSVRMLIDNGASLSHRESGKDYLFYSVFSSAEPSIIRLLLNTGKFDLTFEIMETAVRKFDEETLMAAFSAADLDLVSETSLFEEALDQNLYNFAELILSKSCPKTIERLKETEYLKALESKINFNFSFSFVPCCSDKRKKPGFSKDRLESIKNLLMDLI